MASRPTREHDTVGARRLVEVSGGPIEVDVTSGDPRLATLVFLHEGLGSIDLWRGFPHDVRSALGDHAMVVYSRHGHGHSAAALMPRPATYMHHEADVVLPELRTALDIDRTVLVGHSDGASIALLHAGAGHAVEAIVLLAAHVFVEPESIRGIARARSTFDSTDMGVRMGRYHDDPEATFRGWNDVWLSDEFRDWNIEDRLAAVAAPTLAVQGTGDEYGTVAQVDAIERGIGSRLERLVLDDVGHSPHLQARDRVVAAIVDFLKHEGR